MGDHTQAEPKNRNTFSEFGSEESAHVGSNDSFRENVSSSMNSDETFKRFQGMKIDDGVKLSDLERFLESSTQATESRCAEDYNINTISESNDGDQDNEVDRGEEYDKYERLPKEDEIPKPILVGTAPDTIIEELSAGPVDIIPREEWGARPRPRNEESLQLPVLYVHLQYYTEVGPCFSKEQCVEAVREIQRLHIEERGLPDIAHNFLIGGDGNVYEGRGWNVKAEKTTEIPKYSGKYVEFAYIGDFRVEMQTNLMMKTQFSLLKKGIEENYIDEYFTFIIKWLNLTRDWIGK